MSDMNIPLVTAARTPHAGNKGECFWCRQAVGQSHLPTCSTLRKRALVRVTLEYEIDVHGAGRGLEDCKASFEFGRNEGSWCADNFMRELEELSAEKGCLCASDIEWEFLRFTEAELRDGPAATEPPAALRED